MAKFGEGDKRWIVSDRPDGTNVHNWHWAETNCLEWSRTFFRTLFADVAVADGDIRVAVKKVEKLDGEAYVNVRKGKVIPGYEISVTVAWEGEARDAAGKILRRVDGAVEIPYISDENAGEDPEVRVSVKDSGEFGKRAREVMVEKGKAVILEKVRVWVESMAKGGPVKDELEAKKVVPAAQKNNSVSGVAVKKEEKSDVRKGCKTIGLTERFSCRARDLFEILMDENRWRGFTQSNARISKEVGGEFSIFDGSVTGRNLELQEGKLIVQRWRFGSWPDGMQSTVRIVFEEPEAGITTIKLTHSDVPEEDSLVTEVMWLLANADMGMQLWWRTQRGDGGTTFSKGYGLCLVLEFEVFRILCVVEFLFFVRDFVFFSVRRNYWIGNGSFDCERFAMILQIDLAQLHGPAPCMLLFNILFTGNGVK
ncbi:Activator of 90 kDa heat shock protein ATPase-like 1, partial [Mucuna pruriens]